MEISASILNADFTHLGEQVREALDAGVDRLHLDVMDGQFVPNLSMGPMIAEVLSPLARSAGIPMEAHLMTLTPERLIPAFAVAGVDLLTVHVETCPHLNRTIHQIKELGMRAGVTLNPATPLVSVEEILPDVDLVLVMSVNPGFGGQEYLPASSGRLTRLRQMLESRGLERVDIEVDGGVKYENIAQDSRLQVRMFLWWARRSSKIRPV